MGATLVTYPLLLVKSRLMSTSAATRADLKYSGTWDALTRIYKDDGTACWWAVQLVRCLFLLQGWMQS